MDQYETIRQWLLTSICAVSFFVFLSCEKPPGISGEENLFSSNPTFSEINENVFQPKCLSCHSGGSPNFSSYATLMAGSTIVASAPNSSSLYYQVSAALMPKNGNPLTESELNALYLWIAAGALNDVVVTAPADPSALVATASSQSQIDLTWTDNSSDETGFKIERSLLLVGPFTFVATVGADVEAYSDTGLSDSTTYYYRVYAYNSGGDSNYTAVANDTTDAAPIGAPTAPSGLAVNAVSSSQLDLTWTDNSSDETGFKVEQATDSSGPFTVVATLGSGVTSYPAVGLSAATTYYYRVYAYNGGGNSGNTSTVSAATFGTYTWINANIVVPKCASCHGFSGGYSMGSYADVVTRVSPSNSSGSLLYQRVQSGSMPQGGPVLTASELEAIQTWIDAGANDD